jgi:tRNA(Ile)-lysidine synthase
LLEKKFQPAVIVHLCTLAALAREDAALLDSAAEQQAETFCEFLPEAVHMDVATLLGGPEPKSRVAAPAGAAANAAMAKRVVRTIVRKLKPRAGQLTSQHVAAILKLAEHGKPGKYLPLPGGLQVHREHATLVFSISPPRQRSSSSVSRNFEQPIDLGLASGGATVGVEVPLPHLGCVFRFTTIDWPTERRETSPTGAVLDRDVLRSPLVLRNWRPGDVFQPAGHRRAHKMKRLLNQHRISGWERDGWPVLTSGGVLVWARGFPAARAFAASERTQAGIVIAEEKLP